MHDAGSACLNLLIAEDHPLVQSSLQLLVDSWGYRADIVSNGREAVRQAQAGGYDLCLMDGRMPEMDGLTAVATIRRRLPYLPILMHSSDASPPAAYLAEKGIDEWISKGCDPEYLHQRIAAWGDTKMLQVTCRDSEITTERKMPMDAQHAQEIQELKEKGLAKVKFGVHGEELILHKNATNKVSHDFIAKDQQISVFLNHDPEKPTRCELYRQYCHITQTYLSNSDYNAESTEEADEMAKYPTRTLRPEKES
jgi:CheY-like chemotaxis protein